MNFNTQNKNRRPGFVETPLGILTNDGNWYHASSKTIEQYIPGLLKERDLESIIETAENWVKSAESVALVLYFALTLTAPYYVAVLLAVLFNLSWHFSGHNLVNLPTAWLFKYINKDAFLYLVAFIALSYLGIHSQYGALVFGIVLFLVFKIGLSRRLYANMELKWLNRTITSNDRVLRMVLLRYALKEHIRNHELQQMEEGIAELMRKRQKRTSKK